MLEEAKRNQKSQKKTSRALRQLQRLGVEEVPKGWTLDEVGKACSIRNELRLPLSVDVRASMQGEYPYYGPTGVLDLINEYRVEGDFALIGEDGDHFLDSISKQQTIHICGKFNVNNHAHIIGETEACSVYWFVYFFQHRDISHSLTRQGAGRYKLTKAALEKLPILLPPLPEQRKIAAILRTWDEATEKLGKLLASKVRYHSWLEWQIIGEKTARHDWTATKLGDILIECKARSAEHDEYPVLTSSRRGLFLQSEYFSKQVTSSDNTGYKVVGRGDFTYRSMSDDGLFVFNRLLKHERGIISPAYGVFRAKGANPAFLAHFLNSSYFAQLLARETQGGTRKALRFSALSEMVVDLPALSEQQRIASALDQSNCEIELIKEQMEALSRQKRGLMQKLLTGEWRVEVETEKEAVA